MWEDTAVEEVRKVRREHAKKFNYDLALIYKDLKEEEKASGRKIVSLPSRRPEPVTEGKNPQ